MTPPPERFVKEAIGGPGCTAIKSELMSVRTDDADCRNLQIRQHARDGVGIAIEPPADGEHRTLDRAVVLVDGAVFPKSVAGGVHHPSSRGGLDGLQPLLPVLPPRLSHDPGVAWKRKPREERRAPVEIVVQEATTHIVHIVGVAVVSRAGSDDGTQRRRTARSDL